MKCIKNLFCKKKKKVKKKSSTITITTKVLKSSYSGIELEILSLVNEYRLSKGLKQLKKSNELSTVAQGHSIYMAKNNQVSHHNFNQRDRAQREKGAIKFGENVGGRYNSAQGVVKGWLKSERHRKVIEYPKYTHFGISVEKSLKGINYFTQTFAYYG